MKKLEISQMENLQGGNKNRDCALMGAATLIATGIGLGVGGPWGAAAGGWGGVMSAIGMGCFS